MHFNQHSPGYWKLNTSFLLDNDYVNKIWMTVKSANDEYSNEGSINPALRWKMITLKISDGPFNMPRSKKKRRTRRTRRKKNKKNKKKNNKNKNKKNKKKNKNKKNKKNKNNKKKKKKKKKKALGLLFLTFLRSWTSVLEKL